MGELLPRLQSAARCWPSSYDIGLNIDAEEADRLELSLDLIEAPGARSRARGLERHRLRRAGLPEALPVRDRLAGRPRPAQRPPVHGAPGQGRLLGQRDQARPGRRAGRLSGLHAQGLHRRRLPRLRQEAAGGAGRDLSRSSRPTTPIRWPRFTELGRRQATTSSSACTAWARRSTTRWSGRRSWTAPAASTRRSARTRRCWPTSCGACSRTAPTRRSSTGWSIPRCRSTSWWPIRSRRRAQLGGRPYEPHPAAARAVTARARRNSKGVDLSSELDAALRCSDGLEASTRVDWAALPDPRRRRAARCRRRCRSATRPTAAMSSARCARPTRRMSKSRWHRGRRAAPAGPRPPVATRGRLPRAHGRPARGGDASADRRSPSARPASRSPTPWPRCARRWTSAATTRRRSAPSSGTTRTARWGRWSASALELPARDLHRRGQRGAGGGQPGAGQAGRADPADRCARRAAVPPGRRAARRTAAAAGQGEPSARRWSRDPRVRGVVFTGSTEVAQLINRALARARAATPADRRDRRPERDDRRHSSALPEQVVQDVLASAFDSAGQRCSALRVLFLQEDIADETIADAEGRDGRAARRQSGPARHRYRPGDRPRGAGRPAGAYRADAAQVAKWSHQAQVAGRLRTAPSCRRP